MGLEVDDDGKVHQVDDDDNGGGFSPIGQMGHHVDSSNVRQTADEAVANARHAADEAVANARRAAGDAADRAKELLKSEAKGLLPEIPWWVYAAAVAVPAVAVGGPLAFFYFYAKTAAKVAQAAAPLVAQAGPALLPLVPEAAPLVAAASVLTSLKAGAPPPPDAVSQLLVTARGAAQRSTDPTERLIAAARGTARAAPPVVVESAPPMASVPIGAGTPELPRALWAWRKEVPSNPGLLSQGPPTVDGPPPVSVLSRPPPAPSRAPAPPVSFSGLPVGKTRISGI